VSDLPAEEIISRDAKEYPSADGETFCIAQIETIGKTLLQRKDELLAAMGTEQERQGYPFFALMITDILSKGTDLLVSGDKATVERTLGQTATDDNSRRGCWQPADTLAGAAQVLREP
jgi:manganese-dependent inorganic pyrophosphatase